jgi:hypothetical protein
MDTAAAAAKPLSRSSPRAAERKAWKALPSIAR